MWFNRAQMPQVAVCCSGKAGELEECMANSLSLSIQVMVVSAAKTCGLGAAFA